MIDAFCGRADYTQTDLWVKLHTGDPGAAGTNNAAAETDRIEGTFGAAAASGAITNTAALEWAGVSNTENYTHVSLWTASSGGTFKGSDDLSSTANMTAGDTFRIPAGELDVAIS
jgi:hypothetical protein